MNKEQYKAHFRQRLSEDMDSTTKDKVFGIIVGGAAAGAVGSAVALARANAALDPKTKNSTTPSKPAPPQQGVSQPNGVAQRPVTTTPTASTRPVSTPTASTRPVSTPTTQPIRPYIPVSTPTATTATTPKPTTPTATTPPMFPSDGKAVTIHGGAGRDSAGYDTTALSQLKKEHPKAKEMLDDPNRRAPVDFTYPLDHPTHPGVNVKSTMGLDGAGRDMHGTITVTSPKGSSTTNMTGATPHIPAPHVPDVTPPHVPKVRGAGLVGLLAAPLIGFGTALYDKKSLAAAGGDAVEAAVNNLDPLITTTLGDSSLPDRTPEQLQTDMDAANAQREKQAKDEEEKTKQNALNDTKSGNNSLNKTITDILSGAAKKNI